MQSINHAEEHWSTNNYRLHVLVQMNGQFSVHVENIRRIQLAFSIKKPWIRYGWLMAVSRSFH